MRQVTPWVERRAWAVAALDELRARQYAAGTGARLPQSSPTVSELAAALRAWWDAGVDRVRTPTTLATYRSSLLEVEARFGRERAASLRPAMIDAWVAEMRAAGLAASTIRARLDRLAQLLQLGVRQGRLYAPPLQVARPRMIQRSEPVATPESEYAAMLAAARAGEALPLLLAGDAGLRRAEIVRLRWRDVDLRPAPDAPLGSILVASESDERRTKSGRGRRVPILTDRLLAALETAPRAGDAVVPLSPYQLWKTAVEARQRAGLPPAEQPLHQLRHRAATALADAGATAVQIRDILGHSSIATSERYLRRRGAPGGADLVSRTRATAMPPEEV